MTLPLDIYIPCPAANLCTVQGQFRDLLAIDFMYMKTYVYSLALQAVAERTMNSKVTQGLPNELLFTISNVNAKDYEFIQNVIDGAKAVLQAIISMEWTEKLRFLPVRVYMRIISACISLLKVQRAPPARDSTS